MLNFDLARKRRKWLELTQRQLAERVGVDHTTVAKWESGEREPRSSELVAWATALGLDPAELLPEPEPAAKAVGE